MGLSVVLFLGIQYECYDIPISGIYLFTLFVWKNTGSQRVYVATDSHSHWQHRYKWNILGYEVLKDAEGTVLIGGGLGYFLSYELGTFLAQCINFPLQRNITFHSKGKISWQIFWYFIAWLLISFVCNAVNGLWIPLAQIYFTPAVYNLLVTFITGGVSMVIYFFVFKIIFPEGEREHGK